MPKFSYKVRDREDRVLLGTMEAVSPDEVLERLTQKDLLPILIKELTGTEFHSNKSLADFFSDGLKNSKNKVPYRSVVFFTRQLATMVGQGVPLSKALDQLTRGERPVFKKIIQQISNDIATGQTLSAAVSRHPGAFSPMYIAVVNSGEESGALDRVLEGMANYMESVEIMRGKVKSSLRYPSIIGGFVGLTLIGIMWFLVPVFETIYASLNAQLPKPTLILISISHLLKHNTIPCIGLVVLIVVFWKYLMTKDEFKIGVQKILLRIPVFGGIIQKTFGPPIAVRCPY